MLIFLHWGKSGGEYPETETERHRRLCLIALLLNIHNVFHGSSFHFTLDLLSLSKQNLLMYCEIHSPSYIFLHRKAFLLFSLGNVAANQKKILNGIEHFLLTLGKILKCFKYLGNGNRVRMRPKSTIFLGLYQLPNISA